MDETLQSGRIFYFSGGNWSRHDKITVQEINQKKLLKSFSLIYGGKIKVQNSTTYVSSWEEK